MTDRQTDGRMDRHFDDGYDRALQCVAPSRGKNLTIVFVISLHRFSYGLSCRRANATAIFYSSSLGLIKYTDVNISEN